MNACNIVFIDEGSDFFRGLCINAAADLLIALFPIRRLLRDPCRIFFKNLPQCVGNQRNVLLRLFQFMGIQIHIFNTDRGCQNIHVPVINITAAGSNRSCTGLVAQRFGRVIVVLRHHELIQLGNHRQKYQNPQQRHHQHNALMLTGICPQAADFLVFSRNLTHNHRPFLRLKLYAAGTHGQTSVRHKPA